MRWILHRAAIVGVAAAGLSTAIAAPPPPPPPGAIERADAIIAMPREGDLAGYMARFARDVTLTERDAVVARGRDALARYFEDHRQLRITVLDVSYGNPIMVAERVSTIPDGRDPRAIYDCCFWARVATYHLNAAGEVDRIAFIENDAYWGRPEAPR